MWSVPPGTKAAGKGACLLASLRLLVFKSPTELCPVSEAWRRRILVGSHVGTLWEEEKRGARQDRSWESKGKHDSRHPGVTPASGRMRMGSWSWGLARKSWSAWEKLLGRWKAKGALCVRTVGNAFGELGLGFEGCSEKQMPWPVLVSLSWQPHKLLSGFVVCEPNVPVHGLCLQLNFWAGFTKQFHYFHCQKSS